MTAAKAVYGAIVAFVAPGAAYLVAEAIADGVTGNEWLTAACISVIAAAGVGGVVYQVQNKPTP